MKTGLVFFFTLISMSSMAQSSPSFSMDWGSYRNRYLYPISQVRYTTPEWQKWPIQFQIRLRSYGSWYLFSKSAYDLSPQLEYLFHPKSTSFSASLGVGLDTRIRLVQDERSNAKHSAEPMLISSLQFHRPGITFTFPTWLRLYSNGMAYTVLPECSLNLNARIQATFRYELSYLKLYNYSTHEWRRDCFVGLRYLM
jgi:hypothetical protein